MSSLDIASTPGNSEYGIAKAKRVLKQLSSVVDALLFFARNDVKDPEMTNISQLIKTTLGDEDKRVSISGDETISQKIYPELFMAAVGNIVSNAQKFTGADGKIEIIISNTGLSISDTGIGISPKDLTHIFDRLYKVDTARTSGSGHGLGLSIARKIIEDLHGMKVSAKSKLGQGTVFSIDWSDRKMEN